ncbi:acyl-CoA thioesterase [Rhodobacter sp. Har01]|uniref:acyl-CoA thioesterase n=1 Tax=Rhodobacter sp. Har01 TaxID=2883999 RepID=UPI001D083891|nr:thioesterase family protein [Rhodobacter sp. Har01]MCB6177706.1 acyl-CoA thioesterase [Rhodobacter sp. Har01]
MIYHRSIRIEFNHCDPAGIVFYPRYFEMTNSVAENFFRDIGHYPYEAMMAAGEGVPTVRAEVSFHAPSRLGEVLDWQLLVTRLGTTSIGLHLEAHGDGVHRLAADVTLVFVGPGLRPQPWPPALRNRLADFIAAA